MSLPARKIVILNGNHLCHNPRVIKEAECLTEAGFDVEILGARLNVELAERDRTLAFRQRFRFTPVVSLLDSEGRPSAQGKWFRGERWVGMQAVRWLGLQSPMSLGYGTRSLLAAARARDAGLYIAHSEPALWVASRLHRAGRRIGVDMEDWFSNDLIPESRRSRPMGLLRSLEAKVLENAAHSTCTSLAMSDALAREYRIEAPVVIYNAFPWAERENMDGRLKDRSDRSRVSLHWFSQTIGPDRGLEDLFAALPLLHGNPEIHIRGSLTSGSKSWLERLIAREWRDRVHVHPIVANDELLSRISEHDIGLALDPPLPVNRDVTVTNKALQYALAGLAVVSSTTLGHREIASRIPVGMRLYASGKAEDIAAKLNGLIDHPAELAAAKAASLAAAREFFCWEKVAPRLVASVERAFSSRGVG